MPLPIGSPCAVTGTKVCRAPEHATTSTSPKARGAWARASAQAMTSVVHQRSGSCSAQPTWGGVVVSSDRASATRPSSPHSADLGDRRAEVDGEDHRPCTSPRDEAGHLGRVRVLVEGAPHGHAGAAALHDVAHLVEHAVAAHLGARAAEEEDGHTDARHHPGHGALALGTGARRRAPGP